MKLKKIASLALAGIMAVSMLAGCKTGSSSNSDSTVVTPVDNSVVTYVNGEMDAKQKAILTFSSDATLQSLLEKVAGGLTADTLKKADPDWLTGEAMTTIRETLDASTQGFGNAFKLGSGSAGNGKDTTAVSVLVVPGKYTDEAMKEAVMSEIDEYVKVANMPVDGWNGGKYYEYDYAGKIAVTKVESNDGDYSAYLIAIVVDQTVTERA